MHGILAVCVYSEALNVWVCSELGQDHQPSLQLLSNSDLKGCLLFKEGQAWHPGLLPKLTHTLKY